MENITDRSVGVGWFVTTKLTNSFSPDGHDGPMERLIDTSREWDRGHFCNAKFISNCSDFFLYDVKNGLDGE